MTQFAAKLFAGIICFATAGLASADVLSQEHHPSAPATDAAAAGVAASVVAPITAATPASTPAAPKSTLNKITDFTSHASQLAVQAVSMLGIHYKYGGTNPDSGMDCSGMVRYVFKEAWGTDLPRTSADISHVGQRVDEQDLKPGDLVFYNTLRRGFSHVGIYLGDNKFIHAPSAGGKVRIESMDLSYWKRRFSGARRIDEPDNQQQTQ